MIKVHSTNELLNFVGAAIKIVPDAKFTVNKEGAELYCVNESRTARGLFNTKAMTSEREVSFCLKEINKLHKALTIMAAYSEEDETLEIDYDGRFIKYDNKGTKFKFHTVVENVIERYIGQKISTELSPLYSVTCTSDQIRKVINVSSICSADSSKVYIRKEGDKVIAEIDDKNIDNTDSIAIPLSDSFEGSWTSPIIVKLDIFRLFNVINSTNIKISMTNKKAIDCVIDSELTTIRIIASAQKS